MTLPTDSITLDSFFTSTIKLYETELQKNFLTYWPGVMYLMQEYAYKRSGSYAVQIPVEFGVTNTNTTFFDGTQQIGTDIIQSTTAAIYPWRNVGSSATISMTDEVANTGKAELFDIFKTRIDSSLRSTAFILNNEVYSDGSNFGGRSIIGLNAGVTTAPTSNPSSGAVGGIDAPTNVWWQNAATTSFGSWAANGVAGTSTDNFITAYNNVTDGPVEAPNLILSGQDVWERYYRSMLGTSGNGVRFVSNDTGTGDVSFQTLSYMGKPWTWDRMCPSGRAYMLNTKYVHFYIEPNVFFKWTEPRVWPDQFAKTRLMALRCALVYKARQFQAVVDGITA